MKCICCTRLSHLNNSAFYNELTPQLIWAFYLACPAGTCVTSFSIPISLGQKTNQVPTHFIRACKWQEELQKLILKMGQSFGFFNNLCKGKSHGKIRIKHFPWMSISPSLFQQHPRNTNHYLLPGVSPLWLEWVPGLIFLYTEN